MKVRTLDTLCDIVSGGTPSRSKKEFWDEGNIPWIKISNIKSKYVAEADEYITEAGLNGSSTKMLSKGTILYTIFATLGEVGILDINACTNQAIAGITIKDTTEVDTDYLYFYLKSKKNFVNNIGRGVAQNNINMSILRKFQVPLPSIKEQKQLVQILNLTMNVIDARKQELQKLDELIKSRFIEMFGNPVVNDKTWPCKQLKDATNKIGSGATPKGGKESYLEEGVSLVRSMNVHDGFFEYKELAHLSDEQAKALNNVEVKEYDVFVNITGASVARSCIVPKNVLPARVNQHVAIIRPKEDILNSIFLNRMFLSDAFKMNLLSIGESGGATRQAITKQQLESLSIIIPPIELQNQFADFVRQVDKSKVVVQEALDKTQLLFDSLMQEYFG